MPSKKILDAICVEGENSVVHYEVYPYGTTSEMYFLQEIYQIGIFEKIRSFYRISLRGNQDRLDVQGINCVSGELFKNWIDHAPENSNLISGLFLGSKGVGYGFYDGGDFFKYEKIKRRIESKISFKHFEHMDSDNTGQSGFNNHIYPFSDVLEVDAQKGIIYAAQLKENIVAPEGKHGSSYCYKKREDKGMKL